MTPDVQRMSLERGYQREDETEPFGYRDGLRNVRPSTRRPHHVFVHRDGNELDEPVWADGGTYMTYLKILQRPEQFAALPDDGARDATIGRLKDGTRLDLVGRGIEPHDESADVPDGLPPTSHVRTAGPRGPHDDTQIFVAVCLSSRRLRMARSASASTSVRFRRRSPNSTSFSTIG
jgi:deferrochelatase/peroxidase EfeB